MTGRIKSYQSISAMKWRVQETLLAWCGTFALIALVQDLRYRKVERYQFNVLGVGCHLYSSFNKSSAENGLNAMSDNEMFESPVSSYASARRFWFTL